ncbi:MAG: DUF5330 domain-containing protein [Rhizobiaceae bacterium]|nr:DUF5330 domain-containing protein [Rhizobiaceae bacterium]
MSFLLRLMFWFAIVLYFLPLGAGPTGDGGKQVDALEAVSAAQQAVEDIAGMCDRSPDVCVTGKAALQMVGERARDRARAAIDTLDEQLGQQAVNGDAPRPDTPVIPVPTARPQK